MKPGTTIRMAKTGILPTATILNLFSPLLKFGMQESNLPHQMLGLVKSCHMHGEATSTHSCPISKLRLWRAPCMATRVMCTKYLAISDIYTALSLSLPFQMCRLCGRPKNCASTRPPSTPLVISRTTWRCRSLRKTQMVAHSIARAIRQLSVLCLKLMIHQQTHFSILLQMQQLKALFLCPLKLCWRRSVAYLVPWQVTLAPTPCPPARKPFAGTSSTNPSPLLLPSSSSSRLTRPTTGLSFSTPRLFRQRFTGTLAHSFLLSPPRLNCELSETRGP